MVCVFGWLAVLTVAGLRPSVTLCDRLLASTLMLQPRGVVKGPGTMAVCGLHANRRWEYVIWESRKLFLDATVTTGWLLWIKVGECDEAALWRSA